MDPKTKEIDVYVQSKFKEETGEWEVSTYLNHLEKPIDGPTGTGQIMKRPMVVTRVNTDKAAAELAALDELKKQVAEEAQPGKIVDIRKIKVTIGNT